MDSFCPHCGAPAPPQPNAWASCPGCYALLKGNGLPFAEKVSELQAPARVLSAHRENVLRIMKAKDERRAG